MSFLSVVLLVAVVSVWNRVMEGEGRSTDHFLWCAGLVLICGCWMALVS